MPTYVKKTSLFRFLERFGREYAAKGPTGYGVRLLVDLVRAQSPQAPSG